MAYTSHGHQIEGTPVEGVRPSVVRCGGPRLCETCSRETHNHIITHISFTKTGSVMNFTTFVRKPFTVEAVEVTKENIGEIAPLVGQLRKKDDGTPYIQVDRRLVPNIFRVYPGFWMTKMGDNVRCYSAKIFKEQFVQNDAKINEWVVFMNGETSGAA